MENTNTEVFDRSMKVLLGAGGFGWVIVFAAVLLGGCAHTAINRGLDDCGTFASSDTGLGIVVPAAGQYERYAIACGTERFSRVVANQRSAIVAGAYAATSGDPVAREEIARTQLELHRTRRDTARAIENLADAVEGGVR